MRRDSFFISGTTVFVILILGHFYRPDDPLRKKSFCLLGRERKITIMLIDENQLDKNRKFNVRAIVSIALFFLVIILFITAVGIQILDELIDPQILIERHLNPEKKPASFLVDLQSIITAIHVVSGFLFCGLSIIHIVKNWKALKGYMKKEKR